MATLKNNRRSFVNVARACVAALIVSLPNPSNAQNTTQVFNEYQIKAVFLFNFGQFVEWTSSDTGGPAAPFVIGVLGDDPFNGFLDETVRGEKIGNRAIVVQRYRKIDEISNCDILFVSDSEKPRIKQILADLRGKVTLTVSDAENFATRGGMVQFVTENKRVQLKINVDAAKASNLVISSKLLRRATIVSSSDG